MAFQFLATVFCFDELFFAVLFVAVEGFAELLLAGVVFAEVLA